MHLMMVLREKEHEPLAVISTPSKTELILSMMDHHYQILQLCGTQLSNPYFLHR